MEESINLLKTLLDRGDYEEAAYQYYKIILRGEQDTLCNAFFLAEYQWKLAKNSEIEPIISEYYTHLDELLTHKLYLKVAKDIKDKTEDDLLDEPTNFMNESS